MYISKGLLHMPQNLWLLFTKFKIIIFSDKANQLKDVFNKIVYYAQSYCINLTFLCCRLWKSSCGSLYCSLIQPMCTYVNQNVLTIKWKEVNKHFQLEISTLIFSKFIAVSPEIIIIAKSLKLSDLRRLSKALAVNLSN